MVSELSTTERAVVWWLWGRVVSDRREVAVLTEHLPVVVEDETDRKKSFFHTRCHTDEQD